jgi:putative ATP-binding cassette transporter
MRPKPNITLTAWHLAKSYLRSEEKNSAWGLLVAVVALNLGNVCISVQINEWNKAFYNALQAFNSSELFRQLGIFGILVTLSISMSIYALYLSQLLQIRWRRWLTRRYPDAWLADRAYYQLQLGCTADNPDQRIAEDLNQFTTYVLSLSVGLVTSVTSLVSFLIFFGDSPDPRRSRLPRGEHCTYLAILYGQRCFTPVPVLGLLLKSVGLWCH